MNGCRSSYPLIRQYSLANSPRTFTPMNDNKPHWLSQPLFPALPTVTRESAIFALILLLALLTRFYDLGTRVMSHDESLHTYFSWLLYRGQGYQHNPMMHGPLQFHLIALSYFLFGASDFSARIPAALFSIATIWMVWHWRRYLGKSGALIAALLLVISPYMLYYGRYVRNEAYAGFSGVLMLYAMLRHLESGEKRYLTMLTAALVLHFVAKETAFIYAAQALLFLAVYLIVRVTRRPWEGREGYYRGFIIALTVFFVLVALAAGFTLYGRQVGTLSPTETALPANPTAPVSPLETPRGGISTTAYVAIAASLALIVAAALLILGYGWERLRAERSFGQLILIGTLVLPLLTPFPINFLKRWLQVTIPSTAPDLALLTTRDIGVMAGFVVGMFALSGVIGLLWNRRDWWKYAALFWGVFTVLYTTVFTNSAGFFTGLIGSLGYWLIQQGVERGSQPWYYYLLIQIPIYEFLPALGTLLAAYLGFRRLLRARQPQSDAGEPMTPPDSPEPAAPEGGAPSLSKWNFVHTFGLLLWWVGSSAFAYTLAGEKMPWLSYHIVWPMILLAGWGLGDLVESFDWAALRPGRTLLALGLTIVLLLALAGSLSALFGPTPPFQGKDLIALQATSDFLLPAVIALACLIGTIFLLRAEMSGVLAFGLIVIALVSFGGGLLAAISIRIPPGLEWSTLLTWITTSPDLRSTILGGAAWLIVTVLSAVGAAQFLRQASSRVFLNMVAITLFTLLTVLTGRAAFRAAYVNYDNATEYLVYAHAAGGVKEVMAQAEEISRRTAGGLNVALAYDASAPDTGVSWPFVWYLRDYTNQRSFDVPSRSLREATVVIVDQKNFDKIEQALGPGYYRFNYIRMWWPNQDYFGLTWPRIREALTNPALRAGILEIWLDRDFSRYAQATGSQSTTLTTWEPADRMRLYIKKDVAAQVWNYGVGPVEIAAEIDPYEGKFTALAADLLIDAARLGDQTLNAPRALAFAADGTFYVADSRNHRILHFSAEGNLLREWGFFGDNNLSPSPAGTFNEPWGVAVGPDGSVYVADTWNHRIQKFTADGQPVKMWGRYGQAEQPDAFWGPRGVAVDAQGRVYVTDTGNKRVVVFSADGDYVTQFGSGGLDAGQFDEPVGIAIDSDGILYIADTWNQRIQTFIPSADGLFYQPLFQWDVSAWEGQSVENKPFIAVSDEGRIFVTDPSGYRGIAFDEQGQVLLTWGEFGIGPANFGLPSGIAIDPAGRVWVTDAGNNRIMRFTLPGAGVSSQDELLSPTLDTGPEASPMP